MKKKILMAGAISIIASSMLAETFELGKIEVNGQNTADTQSNITVIDSEMMQDNERKTVVDTLNLLPGINVQNGGARNEQMIMMRGFDVKHAPLYIDGIPIAVPYDGYVDFSRFTTFDLSEIEVSKGFASVLLGPNTFAGAINMVTKKPTKSFEGEVGAGLFSGGGKDGYITMGSNQGKYYVVASLSGMSRDNYPLSGDFPSGMKYQADGSRNNSYAIDRKINLKAAYTPNSTDEYAFNYIKQTADKGVPVYAGVIDGTIIKDNTTGSPGGTIHFWQWNDWDKESYYFLSKTDFGKWYLKTRVFYDKFDNELDMYKDATYTTLASTPTPYHDVTKGASAELGTKLSEKDTLKFAVHYQLDSHEEGGVNSLGMPPTPVYEMQDQIYSLGTEYKKYLTPTSVLTIGASYDIEKAQTAQNTAYSTATPTAYFTTVSETTLANAKADATHQIAAYSTLQNFTLGDARAFNPMIKLDTQLNDTLLAYCGVDRKSRIPSIKDRYSYRMGQFVPNPDLTAESTINYEIGGTKKFQNGSLKASLFYANVTDFIQSAYVPIYYNQTFKGSFSSTQQQQLQNVGNVSQKGAELDGVYIVNDSFSLDGSYTRLLMKNVSTPSIIITDVPKDKLIISGTLTPFAKFSWINTLEFDSERYTSVGTVGSGVNTTNVYYSTGVESTWSTKVIYKATKALSLEAGINNVLDRNYYLAYGYPEAGRVYYGNVRYKF